MKFNLITTLALLGIVFLPQLLSVTALTLYVLGCIYISVYLLMIFFIHPTHFIRAIGFSILLAAFGPNFI